MAYCPDCASKDAEIQQLRNRLLSAAGDSVRRDAFLEECRVLWDSDQDHKLGKLLKALAGKMPGYRTDIDEWRASCVPAQPAAEPAQRWWKCVKEGCGGFGDVKRDEHKQKSMGEHYYLRHAESDWIECTAAGEPLVQAQAKQAAAQMEPSKTAEIAVEIAKEILDKQPPAPPASPLVEGEQGTPTDWDIAWGEGHRVAERELAQARSELAGARTGERLTKQNFDKLYGMVVELAGVKDQDSKVTFGFIPAIEIIKEQLTAAQATIAELRQRLLSAAGDDLCRLSQEEIKALTSGATPIPPKEEFLASCDRFHDQIAGTAGVNHNCLTLAQLIAENERQRREIEDLRSTQHGRAH